MILPLRLRALPALAARQTRTFASSARALAPRAIVYEQNGEPTQVLRGLTLPPLGNPGQGEVKVRFRLSPVNPADINVVQGVYPSLPKPHDNLNTPKPVFIGGNEGLAEVQEVGEGVQGLKKGDWVFMGGPQMGTWRSHALLKADALIPVPREEGSKVTEVHAATMAVNPPTALRMLSDFGDLQPGDVVIQNGANSAVGQAVIQIARHKGLKTINFVRDRDDLEGLKKELQDLGADHVMSYGELADKASRKKIKEWAGGKDIKLALNCVGGKETTEMAKLLGQGAHLVTYGAMSKQPLCLPPGLHIFKDLKSNGFWMTRWYAQNRGPARVELARTLVDLVNQGKLREPAHEIVELGGAGESDEEVGRRVREVIERGASGGGKKTLLRFRDEE